MKNMWFFGGSFLKIKIADIWNFQWLKYLEKGLSIWKLEVQESIIVETTGRRSCYVISLHIV